jgi:hypothetical protein
MTHRETGRGRPSAYTKEIGDEILFRLSEGESLKHICEDDHLPHQSTVYDWGDGMVSEVPDSFPGDFARARQRRAYVMADDMLDIADDASRDTEVRYSKSGKAYESCNSEWVQRSKLRVGTRQYLIDRVMGQAAQRHEVDVSTRYVDTAPQSETYEEWLKQHKPEA